MTSGGSKKLINDVERCVEDCIIGLVAVNPGNSTAACSLNYSPFMKTVISFDKYSKYESV